MSVALRRTSTGRRDHGRPHRRDLPRAARTPPTSRAAQPRRVREQARDAVAVAAVSAATSVALAATAALLLAWLGQG